MDKLLTILIMCLIMGSCTDHSDELYYDLNLKVVQVGENEDVKSHNYRIPVSVKSVLLKDTVNNTYCIMSNRNRVSDENVIVLPISSSKWYNMKKGDILHFDYIRKERFFKIK